MDSETVKHSARVTKGSPEWKRGCWHARLTLLGVVKRPRIKLFAENGRPLDRREEDRELARALTTEMSIRARAADSIVEKKTADARMTVQQFGELWTSGALYEIHGEVNRLGPKASTGDDIRRLKLHVYPFIGHIAVADVQEVDIERMLKDAYMKAAEKHGKPLRAATRRHIYQVTHRLFQLAIKPGRLRKDTPIDDSTKPSKDAPKLFGYLYPDELTALLACDAIPLARRVYYALATYTGLRKSSLRAFTWASLDFHNLTIMSLKSKNGVPQIFAQADSLLPGLETLMTLMRRYYEYLNCPSTNAAVINISDLKLKRKDAEAETLRSDLKTAGIGRPQLFSDSDQIEPLRFHDLRATFITWAKRAGKGDGWISDRSGHITKDQMDRYDRGARMLADLRYVPFPDISATIPELAADLFPNVSQLRR